MKRYWTVHVAGYRPFRLLGQLTHAEAIGHVAEIWPGATVE